jgi:hypothetical protein
VVLQTIGDSLIDTGERSTTEVAQCLAEKGPLPSGQRTWRIIIWETMQEPMFPLLLAAGLLLVFGELQEGLILFGFVTGRATMQIATKKSGAGSRT